MVKLTKTAAFKPHNSKPEIQIDKTTRIVKEMFNYDTEERKIKNDRLRNARLEREAHTLAEPTAKAKRKTGTSKTVKRLRENIVALFPLPDRNCQRNPTRREPSGPRMKCLTDAAPSKD